MGGSILSRLTAVVWVAALCASVYPTWDLWNAYGEESLYCTGVFFSFTTTWQEQYEPYVLALRADVHTLLQLALSLAGPAFVVLVCFTQRQRAAGRRAAGVLVVLAVLQPLIWPYFDLFACAQVPLFSAQWLANVIGEADASIPLLAAAALVLLATQALDPAVEPPATATIGRRRVALWLLASLLGYGALTAALMLTSDQPPNLLLRDGLLRLGSSVWFPDAPWPLLTTTLIILYVLLGSRRGLLRRFRAAR
jgi:hypothetical protein